MRLKHVDDDTRDMLVNHWAANAVATDLYSEKKTVVSQVSEKELLKGELSAVTFGVGCYIVRSARRVYKVGEPGYSPELEAPAGAEEIEPLKGKSMGFLDLEQRLRVTHEISAKHSDRPNGEFTYICRAARATNHSWAEQIGKILTAKEDGKTDDKSASLFVCNTYMGSSFSAPTWYKLDPAGAIMTLSLHPFSEDFDSLRFR